jgi:predicted Zn-dependent protease with MMP-like domain
MHVAFATPPSFEVELEIGIPRQHRDRAQRRAAEVGVQDDASRVDHAAERGLFQPREGLLDAAFDARAVRLARLDCQPRLIQGPPDFADDQRAGEAPQIQGDGFKNLVNGRQVAKQVAISHAFDSTRPVKKKAKSARPANSLPHHGNMVSMDSAAFDRLVAAAYERIPARFRRRLKNIAVMVEAEPTYAQLERSRVPQGGTLLGLYEGRPLTARSVFEPFAMPDRIIVFQGPHERMARSPEHLAQLVEDTVWHEVAHYFGMNEAQVRAAERRRTTARRR